MNLTNEEVKHLTSEQQEFLVSLEIQRVKKREQLLELARKYRVPWFAMVWPSLLIPLGIPLVMFPMNLTGRLILALIIVFVALVLGGVIQSEVKSTNRRIDALIELLEMDKKHPDA